MRSFYSTDMKTVFFRNPGEIDPRAITTLGVSVKESENPIGFFGTGLKYAIAIILREGGTIIISSGTETMHFSKKPVSIRGKELELVCMNDKELSFTTDFGKNWNLFGALRELYCNCIDEGGTVSAEDLEPMSGHTTICVKSAKFFDCFTQLDRLVLSTRVISESKSVNFHARSPASKGAYYRSIYLGDLFNQPARFTPNIIQKVELTEDRTFKNNYEILRIIGEAVLKSKDKKFIEDWIGAPREFMEHDFDFSWLSSIEPSQEFLDVAEALLKDATRSVNTSILKVFYTHRKIPEHEEAKLFAGEKVTLERGVSFCIRLGYKVNDFPISVIETLGPGVLGKADAVNKRIYIAKTTLAQGIPCTAATLIEEWAHLRLALPDESRALQNWLLEQITRLGAELLARGNVYEN